MLATASLYAADVVYMPHNKNKKKEGFHEFRKKLKKGTKQHQHQEEIHFPPINREVEGEKKAHGTRHAVRGTTDHLGRRVVPKEAQASSRVLQNLVNQCALTNLLAAKHATGTQPGLESPVIATSGSDTQVDILALIKKCTTQTQDTLDLSYSGLTDTSMIVLGSILKTHPSVTCLDLSGNILTEHSSPLLVQMVTCNKNLLIVHTSGLDLSLTTTAFIQQLCEAHQQRRCDIDERKERRKLKKEVKKWRNKREQAVRDVIMQEKEHRQTAKTERAAWLADTKLTYKKEINTLQRKEDRAKLRKKKLAERAEIESREADARTTMIQSLLTSEVTLLEVEEHAVRDLWVAQQLASRIGLKKGENSNWIIQRRAEKQRLKMEQEQRLEIETQETDTRVAFHGNYEISAAQLVQSGVTSYEHYEGIYQERIEREQAAEWKRKQEEMRIEAEKQWKRDREIREAAKREMDKRRERERECRSEHLKRTAIEKEDDKRRDIICTLQAIDKGVIAARDNYYKAERMRTALYAATPQPKLQATVDTKVVHFTGEFSEYLPVQKDPMVVLESLAEAKWKDVEKQVNTARKALKAEVAEANKILCTRSIELAPVLLPSLEIPVTITTPGGRDKEKEKEREKELQAKIDEVFDREAIIHHDPAQVVFNDPPSFEEAKGTKMTILGGSLEVTIRDRAELTKNDHILIGSTVTKGKCTAVYPIENGMNLRDINMLLKSVKHRNVSQGALYATRHVAMKLTLSFSSLGDGVCNDVGEIITKEPFTGAIEVSASCVTPFLVAPALLYALAPDRTLTFVEGTPLDKAALFTDVTVSDPPVVTPGDEPTVQKFPDKAYLNGMLIIKVIENTSNDDEIVLRRYFEDDIAIQDDKLTYGDRGDGPFVANILTGNLITHKDRDDKPAATGPFSSEFQIKFTNVLCKPVFINKLLKRLRFINQSQNPSTLRRVVRISLVPDGLMYGSHTHVIINVVSEDDPTQLELTKDKLYYRPMGPTSIPDQLRQHLKRSELTLFPGAKVEDPDTFFVKSGSVKVSCTAGTTKGDLLSIRESDGITFKSNTVLYHDTPMGELVDNNLPDSFLLVFDTESYASIQFIQQVLRNVFYTNTLYSPAESWRTYELTIMLGASAEEAADANEEQEEEDDDEGKEEKEEGGKEEEEQQILTERIEMRVSMELFDVGSHWNLEYKEGMGAVRLAPFDVSPDQQAFVENYTDGYLLVEVASGGNEDDILNVRAPQGGKDGDIKMVLRNNNVLDDEDYYLLRESVSEPQVTEEEEKKGNEDCEMASSPPPEPSLKHELKPDDDKPFEPTPFAAPLSLRDRIRSKIQQAVADQRVKRDSLIEKTKRGLLAMRKGIDERAGHGELTVSDVLSGGKKIGLLVITPTKLLVRFASKSVSRKDVLSVLRLLTYSNRSNDPDVLQKVLRITLKDSGQVPTQLLIQIEIQNIDDVTEIRLANTRPKYRPGMKKIADIGCFPIAGFRKAILVDPDTEYFDGGALIVELVGGGVKGDTLGFMTAEQQELARVDADKHLAEMQKLKSTNTSETEIWETPIYSSSLCVKGKVISLEDGGSPIATIDNPRCSVAGCNNIKLTFTKNNPCIITIQMVTYMLNCITYNASDKLQTGQRTYLIKIRDADNPVEGKMKCFVDVSKPIASHVTTRKGNKTCAVCEPVTILDKVAASVVEGKPTAMLQHGYTLVSLQKGFSEGDQLLVNSSNTNISVKEGNVSFGMDFVGKIATSASKLRVEHSWASKLTAKALTALLMSIQLKCASPGPRTIEFLVYDGVADPSCISAVIDVQ